ncbi:unnamed protein product [Heterobilharzia americana]|nr:unnamed protein product [Heterobilharzia americana]
MEIDLTDESEDVHGPETSYLIEAVGSVLRLYMAEVLMKRPVDPVDYLARCLKKHAQVSDAEMKESVEAVVIEDGVSVNKLEDTLTEVETRNEGDEKREEGGDVDGGGYRGDDDEEEEDNVRERSEVDEALYNGGGEKDDEGGDGGNELHSDFEDSIQETHEDDQSISKFGEETEDEVTFESSSKQELNDTPLDGIDDLGDGEADRDSEVQ